MTSAGSFMSSSNWSQPKAEDKSRYREEPPVQCLKSREEGPNSAAPRTIPIEVDLWELAIKGSFCIAHLTHAANGENHFLACFLHLMLWIRSGSSQDCLELGGSHSSL